eukprot:gene3833-6343_t
MGTTVQPTSAHIVKISGNQDNVPNSVIEVAIAALRRGGVIAVPTDTIYGLACLAQSTAGVRRIYEIKGRDERKPIAICVHKISAISEYASITVSEKLLQQLLPGPVTVVLPRKPSLNSELNPHTNLIGIRVLDFPFVRKLVKALGEPLALTSANRSGEASCIQATEFQSLWQELDVVFDAGAITSSGSSRLGSTVVDISKGGFYKIIRKGSAYSETCKHLQEFGLADATSDCEMTESSNSTPPEIDHLAPIKNSHDHSKVLEQKTDGKEQHPCLEKGCHSQSYTKNENELALKPSTGVEVKQRSDEPFEKRSKNDIES